MRRPALAFVALLLAGCAAAQPAALDPEHRAARGVDLYQATLRVGVEAPRRVQLLPDFWDQADVTVESAKLRAPQTRSVATATSSLQVEFLVPPGPATISVQVRARGLPVASGTATATLMPGPNALGISLTPGDDLVMTLAGNGTSGFANGLGAAARFNEPNGLAFDDIGNLYVADYGNHSIRKVTPDGTVTTLTGNGAFGFSDGVGAAARFTYPQDLVYDAAINSLYVADASNHAIRRIDLATGNVTTPAGSLSVAGFSDGTGPGALFNNPSGLALAANGDLYIADMTNNRIRRMTRAGAVTVFAGQETGGNQDGTTSSALFNGPRKLAFNGLGELFVADIFSRRIRKITVGSTVTTFAGSSFGYQDGLGTAAQFNYFGGMAFDALGDLLVGDSGNNTLRTITAEGMVGTKFSTTAGYVDGSPANARFNYPGGIAVRGDRLYLSDTRNHCIRVYRPQPTL